MQHNIFMGLLGNVKIAKGKGEDVGGYTGCRLGEGLRSFQLIRLLEKQWPLARADDLQPWSQAGTPWSNGELQEQCSHSSLLLLEVKDKQCFLCFPQVCKVLNVEKQELSEDTKKGENCNVLPVTDLTSLSCSGTVMLVPLPLAELSDFSGKTQNLHGCYDENQRSWEANPWRLKAWEWRREKEEGRKHKPKKSL